MTTNDLFDTISTGLQCGEAYVALGSDYESPLIAKAESALATLRRRVADLEAFYQHMVGADYQNTLMDTLKDEMWRKGIQPSESDVKAWSDYDALLERLSNGT